jgi:CDP-glucose 4,6-dehydratase
MGHPADTFWAGRRVLVTGATGFLGGWVVRQLVAREAAVVALVRGTPDPDSSFVRDRLFERVRVVRGRVEDAARLTSALVLHDIETVLHLAAPTVRPAGEPTEVRWAETLLTAVRRATPAAGVVIPVPAGSDLGAKISGLGERCGVAVGIPELPRLFGGGDRTWTRLVPRLARAGVEGRPAAPPTADELAAGYLAAHEGAAAVLRTAETVPAADPVVPSATGSRLLAALVADPTYVPGVPEALAWYRRFLTDRRQPTTAAPTRTRRAA